jgi:hypothetical protein
MSTKAEMLAEVENCLREENWSEEERGSIMQASRNLFACPLEKLDELEIPTGIAGEILTRLIKQSKAHSARLVAYQMLRRENWTGGNYEPVQCDDCNCTIGGIGEWYLLKKAVWEQAWPGTSQKNTEMALKHFLCIGCIEKRLGRKLRRADFDMSSPHNKPNESMSVRLRNRLAR